MAWGNIIGYRWSGKFFFLTGAVILVLAAASSAVAQDTDGTVPAQDSKTVDAKSILDLDIEQLANVEVRLPGMTTEVMSLTRTSEPIAKTPAAVYVVTNEMIRRCGARNIPEVLRTVPGVNVARISTGTWAISIRGFNGRFANKLLVQVDGIAIYSPLHSGVFWERDPVMLEDIERIEIIRGPGGTLWGNNAVNGIINIVTKSSKDTQGVYADFGAGNEHRQFANARVGGKVGDWNYRVWGANMDDDRSYSPYPDYPALDPYYYGQGGFRTDWTPTSDDTITLEGDFVKGQMNAFGWLPPPFFVPTNFTTAKFLARWSHQIDEDTDWSLQNYYYCPYGESSYIHEINANYDIDFQFHAKRGRHDIVMGAGYRNDAENLTLKSWFLPYLDTEQIPSYFIQDTITLVEDRLFATVGSKFDHNSVTHFEYQPSARVTYTPSEKVSYWGAITRAVRTPSLMERGTNEDLKSEDVLAYELGYRQQLTERMFWELATFFNKYDNLIATSFFGESGNVGRGQTYGFEINSTYQVHERWHLTGSYSFCIEKLYYPEYYSAAVFPGTTPRNQFYIQSGWDIGQNITFDLMFRYVDSLPIREVYGIPVNIKNYFVSDMRLAWRPRKSLEFSVVGQNLFNAHHFEFPTTTIFGATEVQPGVYGMVSWRR